MPEARRRLFFALWPDDTLRATLDATGKALTGKRIRRVPVENLHLTLAFVGPATAAVCDCLEQSAAAIRLPPFELTLDHAGCWPRPRILWIAPTRVPPGLWALAGALRNVLAGCGVEPEARGFQAHVTIARKYAQGEPGTAFTAVPWPVSRFCLVQSVSAESGVVYRPLRCWPLEGE